MNSVYRTRLKFRVSNYIRSIEFYRDILGLKILSSWNEPQNNGSIFEIGQCELEILQDNLIRTGNPEFKLSLQISQIDELYHQLSRKIIGIKPPFINEWNQETFSIFDPDDLEIQFYSE